MSDFTPNTLYDIITCNPFTSRGQYSLDRLAISEIVTKEKFLTDLYANTKYIESSSTEDSVENENSTYDFSLHFAMLKEHSVFHKKLMEFESRFSDTNSDLLYIVGPAGSGKSVYINYLLNKSQHQKGSFHNEIIINCEEIRTAITHARVTYKLVNINATELFSIQLLDIVCKYIVYTAGDTEIAPFVTDCYDRVFNHGNTGDMLDEAIHAVMDAFRKLSGKTDKNSEDSLSNRQNLVRSIYDLIDDSDITYSINQLLRTLAIFIYCKNCSINTNADKSTMTYIVFDSIEQYIRIQANMTTAIFDDDIRTITNAVEFAKDNLRNFFEHCNLKFQNYFKFIIVMRDSTQKLLYTSIHSYRDSIQNVFDISGYYDYAKICDVRWAKLLPYISYRMSDNNEIYVNLFKTITSDTGSNRGNSFIEMGLEMFNNNIRRFSASISDIAFELYDFFLRPENSISTEYYYKFWELENSTVCRYLLRRTLFEQLFRTIVHTSNWKRLYIDSEDITKMTLLQRVLLFLARRTKRYHDISSDNYLSLHSLICGVFISPTQSIQETELNYEYHFRPLAEILFAMNQPTYQETMWVPLCVIVFNVNLNDEPDPVSIIARKLLEMWCEIKEGKVSVANISSNFHTSAEYGIRITKAGYFLLFFMSDYSFYLSRCCANSVPLFYNTQPDQVIEMMEIVFRKAKKTIKLLNDFDRGFFVDYSLRGNTDGGFTDGYLFLRNGKYEESLQFRIIRSHYTFLWHYREFLKCFGDVLFRQVGDKEYVEKSVIMQIEKYKAILHEEQRSNRISNEFRLFEEFVD